MVWNLHPIPQTDPPRSPREYLPTMYDLPSEDPEEPGLPDQFHLLQPQLLSQTCRSSQFSPEAMFCGADINLYYTIRQPLWYKRPDWFVVPGVPYLYDGGDMRRSYVIWQEGIAPLVVVELLSPGTEDEDLGVGQKPYHPQDYGLLPTDGDGEPTNGSADPTTNATPDQATDAASNGDRTPNSGPTQPELSADSPLANGDRSTNGGTKTEPSRLKPPPKWAVYESILRVPYYVVFSRYTNKLRVFRLEGNYYEELTLDSQQPQVWIPGLDLGLGLWSGSYEGITRQWLRWYDAEGQWIPTPAEQAEVERQRAESERQRAESERQRAESERQRAESERQRAEVAESQLAQEQQDKAALLERLRQLEARLDLDGEGETS